MREYTYPPLTRIRDHLVNDEKQNLLVAILHKSMEHDLNYVHKLF